MVCTFGDRQDVTWYKRHNFPYHRLINKYGRMNENNDFLNGLKIPAARIKMVEALQQTEKITTTQEITHTVNIHERCKTPIEFILLPQWFISIVKYKKELIEAGNQVNWHPTFMKSRYIDWVQNLSWDWCVSRQRPFGIPFPALHCTECKEIIFPELKDLPMYPEAHQWINKCPACKSNNIQPDTDVMDTWNTSSLTPYICASLFNNKNKEDLLKDSSAVVKKFIPMSIRPQAHDIIRTWAFDTIVKTWMHHNAIPWRDIVISGHVLSEQKKKISKSQGTKLPTPEQFLQQFSADAIRYWTASAKLGNDISFSENQIKIGNRLVTKLWNAFKFIQLHKPIKSPTNNNLGIINEWILHQATTSFNHYKKSLEKFEYSHALEKVEQFFWHDFCDNYIELIKHQLFNQHEYNENQVEETKNILWEVGLRILQLYAPYVPHITETLYQSLYKQNNNAMSIHQTQFSEIQTPYIFEQSNKQGYIIINIVNQIRKLKSSNNLSLKTPIKHLTIHASSTYKDFLKNNEKLLTGITQSEEIIYKDSLSAANEMKEISTCWIASIVIEDK